MENIELYKNPIMITSQFTMCGNCFRADTYRGCDFGCKYCFANNRQGNFAVKDEIAAIHLIEKWMFEAIEKGETNNIKKELLHNRVPLHLGGMADPFQKRELKYGITKEFLKLTAKYKYPVNISTKTDNLTDEYFKILNPEHHTFQISLIGLTDNYIRKYETNTPTAIQRIEFIKELKSRGFWVSIRIQPLIDLQEAIELIKQTDKYVDYYTVEHCKIPKANRLIQDFMFENISTELKHLYLKYTKNEMDYELPSYYKKENIDKIRAITKVKIGCGDNDLHIFSDSLNCCGIDTMPDAFKNWLKYNSMYIKMTGDRTQWYPKQSCNVCLNSVTQVKGFNTTKQYVDRYYNTYYGNDAQGKLF